MRCGPLGILVGAGFGSLLGGFLGRRVALEIPGLGGMTKHEVETMYTTIKEQFSRAGVEPDPSLSPKQVVVQMLENSNKGDGLPFQVRMTASHAAGLAELRDALVAMQDTSPERFSEFLNTLRDTNREAP
ncbi:hypothetical protein BGZ63DRAFT_424757 [Mariannaea sp. PMI_226]|nr:hypothetical protein BGZ63DRAFT_424757 [Mariannaea sp. PMI_226]